MEIQLILPVNLVTEIRNTLTKYQFADIEELKKYLLIFDPHHLLKDLKDKDLIHIHSGYNPGLDHIYIYIYFNKDKDQLDYEMNDKDEVLLHLEEDVDKGYNTARYTWNLGGVYQNYLDNTIHRFRLEDKDFSSLDEFMERKDKIKDNLPYFYPRNIKL